MTMQKIEIEINIPGRYEFVRLDESGETRMPESTHGAVECHGSKKYVIVRPAWQWPDWLTAEWIAMDKYGKWWAFHKKPHAACGAWVSEHGRYFSLTENLVAFTPPLCTDWTQSLRRNPRAEVVK